MDSRGQNHGLSYTNLFNLESLVNFQLPRPDDDNYGSSSQDESRSSQGNGNMMGRSHGVVLDRSSDSTRRRKRSLVEPEADLNTSARRDADSNDEDDEDYENRISEEQYRSMLGEHVQKYRRAKFRTPLSGSASARAAVPAQKRGQGMKSGKFGNEALLSVKEEIASHDMEPPLEHYDMDFDLEYGGGGRNTAYLDSPFLDIGEGITYEIPPTYDKLAASLKLPSFSDIRIDEYFLTGALDLRTLAAMVSTDRRFEFRSGSGLAEPQPQYQSLQARLKSLSSNSSIAKFSLQVSGLDPFSIPEGAAVRIRRSILNESGTLQVYFVKVLEKGDTYEIIERSLPKKQLLRKDPSTVEREEMDKVDRAWFNIARRDIPKHQKIITNLHRKQLGDAKRFSDACQREVKVKASRSQKIKRTAPMRSRKLARDMLILYKRMDKEQAEQRKKEEREAAEALKREEEARESKRQQQRLNFLLSQTELYSHFMQNKSNTQLSETLPGADGEQNVPGGTSINSDLKLRVEEDPEEVELKKEALRAAQNAASQQKKITDAFDSECLKLQKGDDERAASENDPLIQVSNIMNLLNPSTMPVRSSVQTPEMFKGSLKEYQLKGLQWLVNCYEQGLNGILADEMGLGKTIQAMSFLAHLAEEQDNWGPFLVVAPSSVLNNWADEVSRFCPDLKTLPYWGGSTERAVLRKNINPKRLYKRDSSFHILITSYQLLVSDEKYLRRVRWRYMILDEAQAIKSSNSIRWKTLLSFRCRNRLLLTGTPIQNNMAELWALLHFIMPTMFDSHEQFNEWFSKGIEGHAEHGGTLNEHQLNRLHAVLKPFMLRRVKKDVIAEMTSKTEVTVNCKLSSRQQAFYQAIKNKISLVELFDGSRGHLNDKKIVNLMNIVIQLRKVCNHPELFERNEGSSYFYFGEIPNPLPRSGYSDIDDLYYRGNWNPITYQLPKLVYQETMRSGVMPDSVVGHGRRQGFFDKLIDIFSPENISCSTMPHSSSKKSCVGSETFGFSRLINLSPAELSFLAKCSVLERLLFSFLRWDRQFIDELLDLFMNSEDDDSSCNHVEKGKVKTVARMLLLPTKSEASILKIKLATGPADSPYEALVTSHHDRFISNARVLRSTYSFIPRARAPPINSQCPDRSFTYQMAEELHHPWVKRLFVGFSRTSEFNGPQRPSGSHPLIQEIDTDSAIVQPALKLTYRIFGSSPPIQSFDPAKMLTDSGKLQTLDTLLKRLRAENHRVLLFAQMTKMLNILEDYMNYRKYRYFRLDGSSSIMDRRDMVRDFQRRGDVFVFLLSTRAGGLGINLTAADTVIFYESDWNPTLDLQAMDRAHRLGQTKEVTVYRLICKETVEEKILQRASQKNTVQQLVMTGGHAQSELMKTDDALSLLIDDAQQLREIREIPQQAKDRQKKKRATKGIRVDADGNVTLEEFTNAGTEDEPADQDNGKANKKKKKSNPDYQAPPKPHNSLETSKNVDVLMDIDGPLDGYEDDLNIQPRPKRVKRPKSSVDENPELVATMNSEYQPSYHDTPEEYGAGLDE